VAQHSFNSMFARDNKRKDAGLNVRQRARSIAYGPMAGKTGSSLVINQYAILLALYQASLESSLSLEYCCWQYNTVIYSSCL
jgi:hypothetical protein